jgi:hypothetical protein
VVSALLGALQIRESGVPAVVVRPCALTEEPIGAPLEIDQGDVIKVRCMTLMFEPHSMHILSTTHLAALHLAALRLAADKALG